MSKITIIKDDKCVGIDNLFYFGNEELFSSLPNDFHALHWDGTKGLIENATGAPVEISSISEYQSFIDFWNTQDSLPKATDIPLSGDELVRYSKKLNRFEAVDNSTVTTSNENVFDANELSQNRIMRQLKVFEITGENSVEWVLSNNSVLLVQKEELEEVLKLSFLNQSSIWHI